MNSDYQSEQELQDKRLIITAANTTVKNENDVGDKWTKYKRSKNFAFYTVLTASITFFMMGCNVTVLNTIIAYISVEQKWCDINEEIINCARHRLNSSLLQGMIFFGALCACFVANQGLRRGRRLMLLLICFLNFLGTLILLVSKAIYGMLLARFIIGIATGLTTFASPTYVSEISPKEVRGKYGSFQQLFVCVGAILINLIGLLINLTVPVSREVTPMMIASTRIMISLLLIPIVILASLLIYKYDFETPTYYGEQGDFESAKKLFMLTENKDDVTDKLEELKQALKDNLQVEGKKTSLLRAIKTSKPHRTVIFFATAMSLFQQLSGINVFYSSSNMLFLNAGFNQKEATIASFSMYLLNFVGTIPVFFLIEKVGRKFLMTLGTIAITIFLTPAAISYYVLPEDSLISAYLSITAVLGFITVFSFTYGPILWIYLFEIFPEEIKSSGLAIAVSFNWGSAIILVFVSQLITVKISFTVFSLMSLISVFIILIWMKETKGTALGNSPFFHSNT